jgi:hypothetical protein
MKIMGAILMRSTRTIVPSAFYLLCLIALAVNISIPAWGATEGEPGSGGKLLWSITPYIWATDTNYDLTAEGTPIDAGEIKFDDLLDTTDASFQVTIETGREGGHFSGFVDLTYLETSDSYNGELLRLETESEQWFIDAALAYWPDGLGSNLNVFGGIRYTDLDDDYVIRKQDGREQLIKFGPQRDFLDVLVGARYRFDLSDRWAVLTHADYAFGDSDGIFILQALLKFTLGQRNQHGILLGYRYKEAEQEESGLEEDYEYKGPVLGFNFRF